MLKGLVDSQLDIVLSVMWICFLKIKIAMMFIESKYGQVIVVKVIIIMSATMIEILTNITNMTANYHSNFFRLPKAFEKDESVSFSKKYSYSAVFLFFLIQKSFQFFSKNIDCSWGKKIHQESTWSWRLASWRLWTEARLSFLVWAMHFPFIEFESRFGNIIVLLCFSSSVCSFWYHFVDF